MHFGLKEIILLVLTIIVIFLIALLKPCYPSHKQLGVYKLVAVIPEIETRIYEVEINGQICGVATSSSFGKGNYAIAISCPSQGIEVLGGCNEK